MAHSSSGIKVVLFDLGSTLIYSKDPWLPIFERADRAMLQVLQQAGLPLEANSISNEFGTFLESYHAYQENGTLEKTAFSALSEFLLQKKFQGVPAPTIRAALDAMYSITQQNWYLEADAIPTLTTLRQQGYLLGIISNTSDDRNVQQLVDRWEIRSFLAAILTSAACGIRKPDERIFRQALDCFGVAPEQAVMVGDSLEADILGANRTGIYSIWITRRIQLPEEGVLEIQPQAVITALDQLPSLLMDIQNDR
jgi:HAD superfamily hydrolase (TIGR01662 family)